MKNKRFYIPELNGGSLKAALKKAAALTLVLAVMTCASAANAAGKSAPAQKAPKDPNEPTLLIADEVTYDDKAKVVTAKGHVEITKAGNVLKADSVNYYQDTDIVRAEGNVVLLQPSGDVMFADATELTSDMADGFIEKVGMLFSDQSRMVAMNAERYDSRYIVAQHGLYTSCKLCEDNPRDPPLWQLRAEKITDDAEAQDVIYRDATVEFDGVPIFYTPYFSHPEPSVKQRDGFLSPMGGSSSSIGLFARVPYYYALSPDTDLTFTPTVSTKDGLQLQTEWRERFAHTNMKWTTSFTRADLVDDDGEDKGQRFRGSLFGNVLYNYNNVWRAGSEIALTTDKSYLSRYSIAHDDVLVNRGFIEGFKGRDYSVMNMYYFEDTRPGSQLKEPLVAPEVEVSHVGEPGRAWGGRWTFDANSYMTTRSTDTTASLQGPDTRKLGMRLGWDRSLVSSTGLVTDLSALTRTDSYWADNVADPDNSANRYDDVLRTRPFAQSDVMLRYPMARRGDGYQQILEPIAQLTAAPNVGTNTGLPNEESLATEFDETNLFQPSRFSGTDRVEGGSRATYGMRHSLVTDSGGRIDVSAGQIYRFKDNIQFEEDSGLREKESDYVGRIDFVPGSWADLNYGFQLDKDSLTPTHQEVRGSTGVPLFRPFVNYISYDNTLVNGVLSPLEEITGGFTSNFAKYYSLIVSQNQAFRPDPGVRSRSVSVNYRDECFTFGLTYQHNATNRTDISSGDSVVFHFYLRNIGGLQTDSFASPTYDSSLIKDPSLIKAKEE